MNSIIVKDSFGFQHSAVPHPIHPRHYESVCGYILTTDNYSIFVRFKGNYGCEVMKKVSAKTENIEHVKFRSGSKQHLKLVTCDKCRRILKQRATPEKDREKHEF